MSKQWVMKKYLLFFVALLLTAAVVTASVLGTAKKATTSTKNEGAVKKTECNSEKKSKCAKFFSCM
jgi:hypothetical protein